MAYDRGESAAAGSPEQWRLTENDAVSTTFPFSDPFLALFPAVSLSHSSPYSNLTIGYQYKYNTDAKQQLPGSAAIFNNTGDGIILTHTSEHTVRVLDFPSLSVRETPPAHVAGAVCTAIDPRGRCVYALNSTGNKLAEFLFPPVFCYLRNQRRYLASGGHDSIVNLFDMQEWICARTITDCEYVAVSSLSHSLTRS